MGEEGVDVHFSIFHLLLYIYIYMYIKEILDTTIHVLSPLHILTILVSMNKVFPQFFRVY